MPGVTGFDDPCLVCLRRRDALPIAGECRNLVQRERGLQTFGAMGSAPGCLPLVHSRCAPVTVEQGGHNLALGPSGAETAKNVPGINIH